jgi:hypothetical protein
MPYAPDAGDMAEKTDIVHEEVGATSAGNIDVGARQKILPWVQGLKSAGLSPLLQIG